MSLYLPIQIFFLRIAKKLWKKTPSKLQDKTMDYVDESNVEVFTMKLTLVMYWRENRFHSKLSNLSKKKSVLKLVVL